ncbi:MAG: hypothetical protein J6B29_00425 [Clostridia bacterium]|nr:hypothetical protein [Clostridia bacterium]
MNFKKKLLIVLAISALLILALSISIFAEDSAKSSIFTYKGYSVSEFAQNLAIGYGINHSAIEQYESSTGKSLELGVVFASYDLLGGQNPLDENCQPIPLQSGRVLKLDMGDFSSSVFNFILTGITEEFMNHKFVISAYIYDGESVCYVQDQGISDTVSSVTFNEALDRSILTDDYGFTYKLENGTLTVIDLDRPLDSTIKNGITVPYSYEGYAVTAIGEGAFQKFGAKFAQSEYANLGSGFVTMFIPTSVTSFGDYAFKGFFGLSIMLYSHNGTPVDTKAWDATVDFGVGNGAVRDCIWYFRPAIGWSRYSGIVIPDWYE